MAVVAVHLVTRGERLGTAVTGIELARDGYGGERRAAEVRTVTVRAGGAVASSILAVLADPALVNVVAARFKAKDFILDFGA